MASAEWSATTVRRGTLVALSLINALVLCLGWVQWRIRVEGPPIDGVHLFQLSFLLAVVAAVLAVLDLRAGAVPLGLAWAAYALAWLEAPPATVVIACVVLSLALLVVSRRWTRLSGAGLLAVAGIAALMIL